MPHPDDSDRYSDRPGDRGREGEPGRRRDRDDDFDYEPGRGGGMRRENVPNYLVPAILVTLFCCIPLGIVSIVYAAQVNGKLQAGDYEGAVQASNNAKMWCWIAFGLGLVANIIVGAIQIAAISAQQGARGF